MANSDFTSQIFLDEEQILKLLSLTDLDAVEIGEIATSLGNKRRLPIAIKVRIGDWRAFHVYLEGTNLENDWWINRKAAVVNIRQRSTIFERVSAQVRRVDWHIQNNLQVETHAINGGALPLFTNEGFRGTLIISGLSQVRDHLFAVEILTEFLARKCEAL